MKNYFSLLIVIFFATAAFTSCAPAAVTVRPAAVVRVRPVAPSPRHIWVSGGYVYRRGGGYRYNDGYWALPQGRYNAYTDGYWRAGRRGYVWVPGYWR